MSCHGHFQAQPLPQQGSDALSDAARIPFRDFHQHLQIIPSRGVPTDSTDELPGERRIFSQHGSQCLRIDIDTPDLHHVVAATQETFDALQIEAQAGGPGPPGGKILGVETDDGIHIVFVQTGYDQIPGRAVLEHRVGFRVADLRQLGVFHHVHAILIRSLRGNQTRIAHAVPVIDLGTAPGCCNLLAGLPTDVTGNHADRNVLARFDSKLRGDVGQPLDIVHKTHDHVHAKGAHEFYLLTGAGFHTGAG